MREALWSHHRLVYGAYDYYAALYSDNENAPGEPDVFNVSFASASAGLSIRRRLSRFSPSRSRSASRLCAVCSHHATVVGSTHVLTAGYMNFCEHNGFTSKRVPPGEFEVIWAVVNAKGKAVAPNRPHASPTP